MVDLINGRAPEEIKAALCVCTSEGACNLYGCYYSADNNCRDRLMRDALAYIERLEAAQPKWISVKDRLPEAFQCVIVHVRHTKKWRDKELDPSKWWRAVEEDCWSGVGWCGNADEDIHEVTHWMPLPEPPEVEE